MLNFDLVSGIFTPKISILIFFPGEKLHVLPLLTFSQYNGKMAYVIVKKIFLGIKFLNVNRFSKYVRLFLGLFKYK